MLLCFGSFIMMPSGGEAMCDVDHRDEPRVRLAGRDQARNALAATGLDVAGRRALDVGASTGGFTDCLLQRGAAGVIAVDVGYGQLDWGLRNDPRVTVLERTNARALSAELLPYTPDLVTIDVSFISLAKILPAVLGVPGRALRRARAGQAPVRGRPRAREQGTRRDPRPGRPPRALVGVGEAAFGLGASVLGYHSSGLAGPKGNKETFVWLAEPGRAGGARDTREIEMMAREVEP